MKRAKRIYVLLGILAVACIGTFLVMHIEEKKEQIKNSDEIVLEVSSDSVTSLSWEYEDTSLAFHKGDSWLYDDDEAFPVDEDKVAELLSGFEAFGVSFIIENVEDYTQYGLDEPVCTISLSTEQNSYEIQLGDYSAMDSKRYVSIGDGNVYLASEDPFEDFEIELRDMIKHDETPNFDSVTGITFAGEESYSLTYEENSKDTYCTEDVYFTRKNGKNLPLDTSLVDSYLDNISSLGLTDYVTYNATEEELQSYGLDAPDLSVTVDYTYENKEEEEISDTFVLHVSRDPEEKKKAEEAAEKEDEDESSSETEEITAYVRVGESQIVYQITGNEYKSLMESAYDDLRHHEVLTADFDDVTQIDIALEGNSYTITSEEKDDERTWYYQEEELDIAELRSAIKALRSSSFTSEQATEKEEIRFTVSLDNENYPQVEIVLYRYDGSYCLAEIDGEPVSLVTRSYVVDLIEAVNAIVLN